MSGADLFSGVKRLDLLVGCKVYRRSMGTYRISQLAERCGVPASTLRFYDTAGLLAARRSPAGYRVYDDAAVRRLGFIGAAKRLGLALDEIRDLLAIWERGACAAVRARMLPLVRGRMGQADQRIAELSLFAAHLAGVHEELSGPAPAGGCDSGCGCSGDSSASVPEAAVLACSLDGAAMTGRVQDWQQLLAAASHGEAIEDGARFTFSTTAGADADAKTGLAVRITRLAAAEQDCCGFFDFTLQLTPAALVLSVRAPADARELLAEVFPLSAAAGGQGAR